MEHMFASVGDAIIRDLITLLEIFIDSNLSFNEHVKTICKKVSQKLTVLLRMANIPPGEQHKVLVKPFFELQFNYCPLLWMFCSRAQNHKINRLHKRSLRIAYNGYTTAFEDLSAKAKTVLIRQRNLRVLAVEMYKIANGLSSDFMIDLMTDLGNQRSTRSNCNITVDEKENNTCSNKSNFCLTRVKTG